MSKLNAYQPHHLICQDGLIDQNEVHVAETYLLLTSSIDPFPLLAFGLARVKLFPLRTRR